MTTCEKTLGRLGKRSRCARMPDLTESHSIRWISGTQSNNKYVLGMPFGSYIKTGSSGRVGASVLALALARVYRAGVALFCGSLELACRRRRPQTAHLARLHRLFPCLVAPRPCMFPKQLIPPPAPALAIQPSPPEASRSFSGPLDVVTSNRRAIPQ